MRCLGVLLLIVGVNGCTAEQQTAEDSSPAELDAQPIIPPDAEVATGSKTANPGDADTQDGTPEIRESAATASDSKQSHLGPGPLLNELLASNRSGRLDDEGQSSDWVEIHNPGNQPLSLDGYRLTDDPTVLDQWSFPNSHIPPGGYLLVWMSGVARSGLAPAALKASAVTIPFERTLIPRGAEWRFLRGSIRDKAPQAVKNLSGWTAVDFDDSAFAVGRAGFGYGDDDDATEFPPATTAVLVRHEFTLKEPLESESLVLQVDYDDGFAAYLNGVRVAAANCPDSEPGLQTIARGSHEASGAERFDLSRHVGLLRPGKNVLAIAGVNTHAESSDMSLKPALGTLPPVCHVSFRLKKDGAALYLVAPDGSIADQVVYPRQVADQSHGRFTTGDADWGYFLTPSPGGANAGPRQLKPVKSKLRFDPKPGACPAGVAVTIEHKSSTDVDIRFTTDGSDPVGTSPLYTGSVELNATSLFRAATFVGTERVSRITSATYLVGDRPALPVLSISMKPNDFEGVHLQRGGNGRGGERAAYLELFEAGGQRSLATGFGLRLHGGAGRRGGMETKKSYRAYFRRTYGAGRVEYDVIPDAGIADFDKLVLRANFGDGRSHGAFIRDQVIRDLHGDMGAMSSNGSWYVVLINGANHGVFNVVERMDEEFFASHIGAGSYDVIKTGETVLSGTRRAWDDLKQYVKTTDFSDPDNFAELARRVDIENFTAYVIVNLWALNLDWPHNNWYAARRNPDGKWIFLCWDAEWGLGGGPYRHDVDPYAFIDSGGAYGHGLTRSMFCALLGNPDYCEYYQGQVRRHLEGALSHKNAMRHIQRHRDAIVSDIEHEFETRGYGKERWHANMARVEKFIETAGSLFQTHTDRYFAYQARADDTRARAPSRVAMLEDADGRRYMVQRGPDGQVLELSCASDGSDCRQSIISALAKSPPAAGGASIYARGADARHVVYRGQSGHLHLLSMAAAGGENATWTHTDLTAELAIPVSVCDPAVVVFADRPHMVYVDATARVREVWFDGIWRQHPLLAAPRAAAAAVISRSAGALHVTYRTMFGSVCQQTLDVAAADERKRPWSPRLIHNLPAAGRPVGFRARGKQRIVFQPAEKWPFGMPFVFRGPKDQFPPSALVHVQNDGGRFWRRESVGQPANPVAGSPSAIQTDQGDQFYLAYRDRVGQLHEATLHDDGWQLSDMTALSQAPLAAGDPTGLVSNVTDARYYVYVGQDGHLHELSCDGNWKHRDLSAALTDSAR